ncbi:MAG: serine/threonine-protein kinase [Rhodoferax sp.]|nr:serine/threonine-protein kinase [Rhodoferax sp.]
MREEQLHQVRICPVCERENEPQILRCVCGASLLLVDFSIRKQAEEAEPQVTPTTPEKPAPSANEVLCPHADCAQPNPAGMERCLYCNRPLLPVATQPLPAASGRLPAALRVRYTEIELLPTAGAEADLVLVKTHADPAVDTPQQRIVKLYRPGIGGDDGLLQTIMRASSPHVVRFFEHGMADGVRYEVMEYCPLGSLRGLLSAGPQSVERIRDMVAQLAQGLVAVQALHILHRDLKPENVLLRSLEPLELVLTDFGIASVRLATQHFTGGARTTRYAAPEALTGVLDDKADWWSLGMIVLESCLGRHPLDGLNEQVLNYHLATKPMDTRGVFHDELRKLCRGLLLRDPKRRWGAAEVSRWLAGDPGLAMPEESATTLALRPYKVADAQCSSAVELAATLAKNWSIGCKDVMRGSLAAWIENELHDHNLLRALQDIQDMRGVSPDWRLLRFILAAAPDIPAVWQGQSISRESLLIAARKSTLGDTNATQWLQSIHTESVLELLAAAQRSEVSAFRQQWLAGLQRFETIWNQARAAEDAWSRAPKAWHGKGGVVVDVDYALYVQPLRMAPPAVDKQHGAVLLALNLPAFVNLVRTEIAQAIAPYEHFCSWFSAIGALPELDAVGVMVARQLLPLAKEDTEREARYLAAATPVHAPQPKGESDGSAAMRRAVRQALEIARQGVESEALALELQAALEPAQAACFKLIGQAATTPEMVKLRNAAENFSHASLELQAALTRAQDVRSINAIWLQPQRLLIAAAIVLGLGLLLSTGALLVGLLLLGGGIAWRLQELHNANNQTRAKLRALIRFADKLTASNQAHST